LQTSRKQTARSGYKLDRFDKAIIKHLLQDGSASQAELGESANLSGPAAGRRLRLLEQRGIITGYQPKIAFEKVGYGTLVMVLVRLEAQSQQSFSTFEGAVAECPSVVSCHLLSGGEDYLITLRARDLSDFERIHREELAGLPGVTRMQSLFALREVISHAAPLSLTSSKN
jgi:Lrp/AsnC family transcriptional regulator, leucine-responsive regulatory protein